MEIKDLTEELFASFIEKEYVLVDFYATWCGPCKMLHPVLEELNQKGSIEIGRIDVDENPLVAQKYGVMSIPTLILFKKGQQIDSKIGFQPITSLEEWVAENR